MFVSSNFSERRDGYWGELSYSFYNGKRMMLKPVDALAKEHMYFINVSSADLSQRRYKKLSRISIENISSMSSRLCQKKL